MGTLLSSLGYAQENGDQHLLSFYNMSFFFLLFFGLETAYD